MKNLREDGYSSRFSHIYVEKGIRGHRRTQEILRRFSEAQVIWIDHYKDVFCRRGQRPEKQYPAQALILAQKTGTLVYEGAKVCQSFGNEYFYYTSCCMNCLFDCEYCYLKGMYPSGHLVVFVNIEDIFAQIEELLREHPVYLCVSYDTDLMALESITGFVQRWIEFAHNRADFRMEIRTKSGRTDLWEKLDAEPNVIVAFTMSPEAVVEQYEHGTGTLEGRIQSAALAMLKGFPVRLCFDPMIYCADWKNQYADMVEKVFSQVSPEKLFDISVGSFRISQDYLKNMRKNTPNRAIVWFPYENVGGVYQYPSGLLADMEEFLLEKLLGYVTEEKIFRWKQGEEI